ncbi:condensation domain-containing protein [Kitasatospora sp. NPDC057198]|uniref:condensation domain-containing protein n=1 Tax=Kitasatospora sp. NPDC057198 TaxID=3346046 RepID=UPI003631056A
MREREAPEPVETVPLSAAQRRFWADPGASPGSSAHHLAVDVRLPGAADERVVRSVLGALAARHGPLRTTVAPAGDGGSPVQWVHRRLPLRLRVVELAMIPERDRPGLAGRLAADASRRPFDLAAGPLWRALLLRSPARGRLHLVAHRLVCDEHSAAVLRAELLEGVTAALAGRAARLPELPPRHTDPAPRQRTDGGRTAGERTDGE